MVSRYKLREDKIPAGNSSLLTVQVRATFLKPNEGPRAFSADKILQENRPFRPVQFELSNDNFPSCFQYPVANKLHGLFLDILDSSTKV